MSWKARKIRNDELNEKRNSGEKLTEDENLEKTQLHYELNPAAWEELMGENETRTPEDGLEGRKKKRGIFKYL